MYLSIIASIVGILFILTGIAGFFPGMYVNGLLFGTFQVDIIHNVFILVVGIIGFLSSFRYQSDRLFFRIFGIIFGLIAIVGFAFQGDLYFTTVNMADQLIHVVIAVVFLVLGFSAQKEGRV